MHALLCYIIEMYIKQDARELQIVLACNYICNTNSTMCGVCWRTCLVYMCINQLNVAKRIIIETVHEKIARRLYNERSTRF